MLNPIEYLKTALLGSLILWIIAVFWHHQKTGELKFCKFPFSTRNYYVMVSALAVYPVLQSFWLDSLKPMLLFALLGFLGMAFEIFSSRWWGLFFKKPFYEYKVKPVDHARSSRLNVIPWGAGALVFFAVVQAISRTGAAGPEGAAPANIAPVPFYFIFAVTFLAGLAFQTMMWSFVLLRKRHDHKFTRLTWANGAFWTFPYFISLSVCAALYGPNIIWLAILFGFAGALAEYLFGKISEFVISKKLWTYNYVSFDSGHFTPVSFLGFSLAGMYFWMFGLLLQTIVK